MKIQELLFPSTQTCDRIGMYYRIQPENGYRAGVVEAGVSSCSGIHEPAAGVFWITGEPRIRLSRGAVLDGSTYFNAFSIGKWRRYTVLNNLSLCLKLKGSFSVQICHVYRLNLDNVSRIVSETCVQGGADDMPEFPKSSVPSKTDGMKDISDAGSCGSSSGSRFPDFVRIPIPVTDETGIYYFRLRALEDDCEFLGGYYETAVSEEELPPVRIAVGICTYRREQYVLHNVRLMREHLIDNPDSPLYQHLEVFISDNGQTLPDSMNSEHVRIFPNKNTGGSGGFTRAMIEVMKERDALGITHILLMDDDVRIEPHAFDRTACFLRLLKPQHRNAFLGGAMLRLDRRNIQSDNGARWTGLDVYVPKANYDMEDLGRILANEIEDTVDYEGWWFCCMPVDVIQEDNLPLPLFIKRDDIEYCLRCGKEFLALNGICVWHETFESKSSAYLDYYYFRNMCIVNARHVPSFTKKRLRKALSSYVRENLKRYQYREAELAIMGVEDYLKGIDAFKQVDGERLNQALMRLSYKKEPIENLDYAFVTDQYERNIQYRESKFRRKFRQMTFNGWMLPVRRVNKVSDAKKQVIVPAFNAHKGLIFRAQKVLHYEASSGKGYVTKKSYANLFYILRYNFRINRWIRRRFDIVSREFRERFGEITNLAFWQEYLSRDGGELSLKSGIPEP